MYRMKRQMTMPHSKLSKLELEKLFEDNYGLLVSQALSFCPRNQNELDDYIQVAAIGMMKACETYDADQSKFSTFAIVCIRNAIKNHLRKEKKSNRLAFYDDLDRRQAYIADSLFDVLPDSLTEKEKFVIKLRIEGYSYKEAAELLNMPVHRLKNFVYNTYRKIRKANEV